MEKGDKVVLGGRIYEVIAVNGRSCIFSEDGVGAAFRLTHGEVQLLLRERKMIKVRKRVPTLA